MPPEWPNQWTIEQLSASHVVSDFACGKEPLDTWLKKYALFNQSERVSQVFVAVEPILRIVDGYYALSSSSVAFANFPPNLVQGFPKYPLPTALIGRLAVTTSAKGRHLGEMLLLDAFKRILKAVDSIGIVAVDILAKDEEAKAFYVQYGFQTFRDDSLHLCLPLKMLKKLGFD